MSRVRGEGSCCWRRTGEEPRGENRGTGGDSVVIRVRTPRSTLPPPAEPSPVEPVPPEPAPPRPPGPDRPVPPPEPTPPDPTRPPPSPTPPDPTPKPPDPSPPPYPPNPTPNPPSPLSERAEPELAGVLRLAAASLAAAYSLDDHELDAPLASPDLTVRFWGAVLAAERGWGTPLEDLLDVSRVRPGVVLEALGDLQPLRRYLSQVPPFPTEVTVRLRRRAAEPSASADERLLVTWLVGLEP